MAESTQDTILKDDINPSSSTDPVTSPQTEENWDNSYAEFEARLAESPTKASHEAQERSTDVINHLGRSSFGRAAGQSLSQLMKLHAQKGKDVILTEDEEKRLSEELGKWINTDPGPYEKPSDPYFQTARPDGQSDAVAAPES